MNTCLLYDNETEEKLHLRAIQTIARETKKPVDNVISLYESVLERYKEHAKIKDYLPILVSREVKEILLQQMSPGYD
ncbi:MAG: hypothetical protein QG591_2702 [Planctomycetota bacterium]|nr:hypothetical protein [Planctomycetota bacterium]